MLYVDNGYGIDCMYPRDGELNRLRPGDFESPSLHFKNNTAGLEQVIIIAVKARGQPVDFSQLVQPPLEQAPGEQAIKRGEKLNRSLATPLGALLERGMFGGERSRGPTVAEMDDYVILPVSISVRTQKRPALPGQ
jgi:hypothetical protein